MNAQLSRRALLTGAAAMPLSVAALPALADRPSPELERLGEIVVLACRARAVARRSYTNARDSFKRWHARNPMPDTVSGGADLLTWLNRCQAAVTCSNAPVRFAAYRVTIAAHSAAVAAVLAYPLETRADLRALAALAVFDHDGAIRAAVLDHVGQGRAGA